MYITRIIFQRKLEKHMYDYGNEKCYVGGKLKTIAELIITL